MTSWELTKGLIYKDLVDLAVVMGLFGIGLVVAFAWWGVTMWRHKR